MSIDICCRCDSYVDTDFDCECYVPDPRRSLKGYPDMCLCENCREKEQAEQAEQEQQESLDKS